MKRLIGWKTNCSDIKTSPTTRFWELLSLQGLNCTLLFKCQWKDWMESFGINIIVYLIWLVKSYNRYFKIKSVQLQTVTDCTDFYYIKESTWVCNSSEYIVVYNIVYICVQQKQSVQFCTAGCSVADSRVYSFVQQSVQLRTAECTVIKQGLSRDQVSRDPTGRNSGLTRTDRQTEHNCRF